MLRWIHSQVWLPESLLAISSFLVLGGLDLAFNGPYALAVSAAITLSLIFVRKLVFLMPLLIALAATAQVVFQIPITIGSLGIVLAAFSAGAFSPKPYREIVLGTSILGGVAISANLAFNPKLDLVELLVGTLTEAGQLLVFTAFSLLAISMVSLSWLLGFFLITRLTHVGTDFDRLVYEEKQARLAIEIAEQSKRFEIARDINEHIVQRMAGVISNAEAGAYAAKANPEAGIRALEKVLFSAKAALTELRRLFDMLNRGTLATSAPPTLDDLSTLAVSLRSRGLDVTLEHFGKRFPLTVAAELAVYRIVFDSLENVKQHTPRGTKATVEFSWMEDVLQVMVKDNGVEVERRQSLTDDGIPAPYDANDDLETLLDRVTGPGITAMRERAESYGGSLEVNRVVGIGFTVAATFPAAEVRGEEVVE
ncbi:MAG: sensor histidine kinase [Actinomycetota bacterium]